MLVKYLPISWYDVVQYFDESFLKIFPWERFRASSTKPVEFKAAMLEKVIINGEEREKTSN